ncbi:hypothetical protein FS837_010436 [Tulasnella sp. UAMH 9824]|nr:hypothetical protein FS837_010436 [Tulasnella sp. UAMH 9824]
MSAHHRPATNSPLLGILLVTSSSTGSHLAWSWPPQPKPPVRLGRPRPIEWETEPDVNWRAAHDYDQTMNNLPQETQDRVNATVNQYATATKYSNYQWHRPGAGQQRVLSYHHSSTSRPPSGRASPSVDGLDESTFRDDFTFGEVLGYEPTLLAEVLSPKRALCHQKFELFVDELAFIGHPVCAREDGGWGWDEIYAGGSASIMLSSDTLPDQRGRPKDRANDLNLPDTPSISLSPEIPLVDPLTLRSPSPRKKRNSNTLHSFHLVLALDRPDPSCVAHGDLYKFIDVYYKQIAFKLTAAMHHEQGRVDYVAQQLALLLGIKEQCFSEGSSVNAYITRSLERSSLASAIKTVFTCMTNGSIAQVLINEIPVQVQLPPDHIAYLSGEDVEDLEEQEALSEFLLEQAGYGGGEDDPQGRWLDEVHYGWKLESPLLPWKALVMLESEDGSDPVDNIWLGNPATDGGADEHNSAKDLLRRFVEYASPTLSLSDIAALLDLDLQSEVYPMARLLMYNRKAKIIDVIPSSLKNIYVTQLKFAEPLSSYTTAFATAFPPPVPPLPAILATLSSQPQSFSKIVPSADHRPMYTEVLIWLLQRDLVVMLHVRIRIVATKAIKEKVLMARKKEVEEKRERQRQATEELDDGQDAQATTGDKNDNGSNSDEEEMDEQQSNYVRGTAASDSPGIDIAFIASSPEVGRVNQRRSSYPHLRQDSFQINSPGFRRPYGGDSSGSEEESESSSELESDSELDGAGELEESIIANPARATATERRWLEAMTEGKDEEVRRLFEKLYVYFDGKKTTDEILFRTDVKRTQLRWVLLHFDEYIQTLLHP